MGPAAGDAESQELLQEPVERCLRSNLEEHYWSLPVSRRERNRLPSPRLWSRGAGSPGAVQASSLGCQQLAGAPSSRRVSGQQPYELVGQTPCGSPGPSLPGSFSPLAAWCPGLHCNYKTSTVALGVMSLGLLITVIALAVSLSGRSPAKRGSCCWDTWVGYQGKCFYFSMAEGNWTYSRDNCSALGASLAGIDTLQEMAFMLRHKGKFDHWIGLRRDVGQLWKWANGTKFNNLFVIRAEGDCAYLNDENGVSSLRCASERHWICSKPSALTAAKEAPPGGDS